MKQEKYKFTNQEKEWSGSFGDNYIKRNEDKKIISSNHNLFSRILQKSKKIKSILELGCNVGLNLESLYRISEVFELVGIDINKTACKKAKQRNIAKIINTTITKEILIGDKFDLVFTKGVLIHINPKDLNKVYKNLFNLSNRYILVAEYYNPKPVTIDYRGKKDLLFKRDFAGELIDLYNLRLIDYGFVYHRDNFFPKDDITWFLLEK